MLGQDLSLDQLMRGCMHWLDYAVTLGFAASGGESEEDQALH